MKVEANAARLSVRLSGALGESLRLLSPGGDMVWGNCEFAINPPADFRTDFWMAVHSCRMEETTCAPQNTLFISGEPPEKKIYPLKFLRQFHHVVDTHKLSRHPRILVGFPALPWHVGYDHERKRFQFGYDYLKKLDYPTKRNCVSVVCSSSAKTPGQRRRLKLLAFLKQNLGDQLVHFGRGFRDINDKMDAILPYRFHLVLENSVSDHYWTEKLSDCYLGWAFPIYLGCPNLNEYFSREAYTPIPIDDPAEALTKIRCLLKTAPSSTEAKIIDDARQAVLERYNPFGLFAGWAEQLHVASEKRLVRLIPHQAFRSWGRGLLYRLRHGLPFVSAKT